MERPPRVRDAGALFTSGVSNTSTNPRGTASVLSKITIGAAATFMLTALMLSLPAITGNRSVLSTQGAPDSSSATTTNTNSENANTSEANTASNAATETKVEEKKGDEAKPEETKEEKKEEKEDKDRHYYRIERNYGSFARTLSLPDDANADEIQANLKDGILKLTIPRHEGQHGESRKIAIEK